MIESEKTVFKGKVVSVSKMIVSLDGDRRDRRVYDAVRTRPAAVVLACCPDGRFVFIRQPRPVVGEEQLLEAVAGKVDPGETPFEAAIRELKEEVGMVAEAVMALGSVYASPGYLDEVMHMFYMDVICLVHGAEGGDEDEHITPEFLTEEEIDEAIAEQQIMDGKLIAIWGAWKIARDSGRMPSPFVGEN